MEFRKIDGFPYWISRNGEIKNERGEFVTKYFSKSCGRWKVSLFLNRRQYFRYVHVALAKAFLPNPKNHKYVCFKNGDMADYSLSNLFWNSSKRGSVFVQFDGKEINLMQFAKKHNYNYASLYSKMYNGKSFADIINPPNLIDQLDNNGNIIKQFKSLSEAKENTGLTSQKILTRLAGMKVRGLNNDNYKFKLSENKNNTHG